MEDSGQGCTQPEARIKTPLGPWRYTHAAAAPFDRSSCDNAAPLLGMPATLPGLRLYPAFVPALLRVWNRVSRLWRCEAEKTKMAGAWKSSVSDETATTSSNGEQRGHNPRRHGDGDNSCIYLDLAPIQGLGHNPYIYRISPTHLRATTSLPDFITLGVVCMTLNHRMHRIRDQSHCRDLTETYYRFRASVIRSLNESINIESRRTTDIVVAGILTLLLIDAQRGDSTGWRWHIEAARRIIMLRGGFLTAARSKALKPLLLVFLCILVIGNTTSSSSDLAIASPHCDELKYVLGQTGCAISPFQMCPPLLFVEVLKINRLRMRAVKHEPNQAEALQQEGYKVLDCIYNFSPEEWGETMPSSREDWKLLGNVYQLAVTVYCISSLQSLSVLPLAPSLRAQCISHGQLLRVLLEKALLSPRLKRFMTWPLVVLGVEVVHGVAMQLFVKKQLVEMSSHIGSYGPLMAKAVLERFWYSGETNWDACFDRPYLFTTQVSVDMSGIL
ncbi:C6 zinc finger domain-containing protein [Arthroderma uncinatum]|uniref:C6 zinc finger domain-containing protein n=1 Tax=Arthroderma uncinatum TaxID=74035 RepID=UPI00144A70DF|nr:C6 zinc finger domain-containing protein [Arthroderma uncinatum]KAF3492420.1 C6 zinc finger domain-containing protein [Arthroderma uncinatum]